MTEYKCRTCGTVRELKFASEKERNDFARGFKGWCDKCNDSRDFDPA